MQSNQAKKTKLTVMRCCCVAFSLLALRCTSPNGALFSGGNGAVSSSALAPAVAASNEASALPLASSSPAPVTPSGIDLTAPKPTPSGQPQPSSAQATAPDFTGGQHDTASPNSTLSPPAQVPDQPHADEPVLKGDVSRYNYAFFTANLAVAEYYARPTFGVVFTADANFCTRAAAPLHLTDFTMYQVFSSEEFPAGPNEVYNVTTWPEIDYGFGPSGELRPPGFDEVGFRGVCSLAGLPEGGKTFHDASWSLKPLDGNSLNDSTIVRVSIHARNNAQEIAWSLDAKRCETAQAYFQNHAGNHPRLQQIPCIRTVVDSAISGGAVVEAKPVD